MKTLRFATLAVALLLFTSGAYAQIEFNGDEWATIQEMAQKQNKYIFVDTYTDWCRYCKKMDKEVFSHKNVGKWYNENFISVKYNAEDGAHGQAFASKNGIKSFPTFVFFGPEGEFVHRSVGYQAGDDFLQLGLDAMDPEKQLSSYMSRYAEGERDDDFLFEYINLLFDARLPRHEEAGIYLAMNEGNLMDEQPWDVLRKNVTDIESPYFSEVARNMPAFVEQFGREDVQQYVEGAYGRHINGVAKAKDLDALEGFKLKVQEDVPFLALKLSTKADYIYHKKNDTEKAHEYAMLYLGRYCDDWNELNAAAWQYFEKEEDNTRLRDAVRWVERSMAIEANWYNTDTRANLLFKLGQLEDAEHAAKVSIKLAEEQGEDPQETRELLNKIQVAMNAAR